jgi:hypothetical protein
MQGRTEESRGDKLGGLTSFYIQREVASSGGQNELQFQSLLRLQQHYICGIIELVARIFQNATKIKANSNC